MAALWYEVYCKCAYQLAYIRSRRQGNSHEAVSSAASLATFLAPTAALAHTGVGDTSGFMHGFMHPLGGLDHQLAMILVGIFAYQLGGRALGSCR